MSVEVVCREGGCRCNRVRFTVSMKPIITMACHCTGCQKMSSSAFSLSALVPQAGFTINQGEPVIGGLHGAARHYFCGYCMSWLFTRPQGIDDLINLRATMLDDASDYVPFMETWTSEKLPWASIPAIHSFAQLPESEEFLHLLQAYAEFAAAAANR
ncbi:GFA family protein [Pseudomonas sp. 15FMM2]|uniref:GFA family protein n=1 Tax=Pseudomonas imrae TaxID=2992837 RepID=A0ACC7PCE5_9PSED